MKHLLHILGISLIITCCGCTTPKANEQLETFQVNEVSEDIITYKTYVNPTYQYTLAYPTYFTKIDEMDDERGVIFADDEKAIQMQVVAAEASLQESIQALQEKAIWIVEEEKEQGFYHIVYQTSNPEQLYYTYVKEQDNYTITLEFICSKTCENVAEITYMFSYLTENK